MVNWELSIDHFQFNNKTGEKAVSASAASLRFTLYKSQTSYYAGDNGISASVTGSGKLVILETSHEYVKGNFEFITGVTSSTNQKRTVTHGEFHIKRDP
jgi:hypothetical protein